MPFKDGDTLLQDFQNPAEADKLTKIQAELNEVSQPARRHLANAFLQTKEIMIVNIEQLLKRGEQLDDLMAKTDDLSKASEQFFRQARANNSCCGQWY